MRRWLFAVVMLLPTVVWSGGRDVSLPKSDDARFLAARDAYRAGERSRLARLAASLRDHPLSSWAEYWQLRLALEDDSVEGISDFLNREAGNYLAERLRADWLRRLGKAQEWRRFQEEYLSLLQPDQELICYALQARLFRRQDASALDDARPVLLAAVELPDSCTPLMDRLVADGRVSVDQLWDRMRRLLENRRYTGAKQFSRYLPADQRPDARTIDRVADAPASFLVGSPDTASRRGKEMVLFAVQRMARSDPAAAAALWRDLEGCFADDDRAYAWGQIAWQAAYRHLTQAGAWYRLTVPASLNDEQRAWKIRAALRVQDWPVVLTAIGELPPGMAAEPEWIYWRGRGLAALGRTGESVAEFRRIAGQPSFYGILATEESGQAVALPSRAMPPSAEELAQASANPGLRRALMLLDRDLRVEGVREWAWSLRGMGDRQLLAAAELARRQGSYDRAINAAEKTQVEHDFGMRYLSPFRDQVEPKARELALDSSWVYGLMRQESRFVMNANSSAGAKGLMQLMPATARWVAKKIGLAGYHPQRVTEMETNVVLGTSYLKMVLNGLDDHPVLASAAYNAGPGRARRWRAEWPLEGAIYAETIPFNETRDYVKKVMSNAVYYSMLFDNKPQSLKNRLGIVRPRGYNDSTVADLP